MRGTTALIIALSGPATSAQAANCYQLYYQRNAIYKAQGYCFSTPRAIQTFDNAGCSYDVVNEVPLSATQRRAIEIIKEEGSLSDCSS